MLERLNGVNSDWLIFCFIILLTQFTFFASSNATDYHIIISQNIFKILNG